jgi:hypothetical protein
LTLRFIAQDTGFSGGNERRTVRYLAILALAAAALVSVGVATAKAPIRASFTLEDLTFPDTFLTEACNQPVYMTLNATLKATLFLDKNGKIVREVDTQPAGTLTYSGDSGGSISFPFSIISHTDYSGGTSVGSHVTATLTGNIGSFTGLVGPGTGRMVLDGEVVFIDENGVPLTAFTDLVSMSGNFTGETAKICAAVKA